MNESLPVDGRTVVNYARNGRIGSVPVESRAARASRPAGQFFDALEQVLSRILCDSYILRQHIILVKCLCSVSSRGDALSGRQH